MFVFSLDCVRRPDNVFHQPPASALPPTKRVLCWRTRSQRPRRRARGFDEGCYHSRAPACGTIEGRSTTSSSRTRGAARCSSATIGWTWLYIETRRRSGAPSGTKLWEIGSRASAPTRMRGPGRRRRADDDAPSWGISIRYIGNNKPEVQKKLSKGYI